mmetsp:Transcript_18272/g.47687  ORF Transcript_18272/g.47687 Transcript_18272/m.47687 type:complete len:316 (+) Transcript_18272:88-1035(+)
MAELTEAEAAVYDRQLRVWGVETQKRLNNARVLIAGLSGLAAEVAKNVVLAGIGSVTLMDDTPVAARKPGNFLVPADTDPASSVAEASAATLRDMNPLVAIGTVPGRPETLDSAESLGFYNAIVLLEAPLSVQERWDSWAKEHGVAFYSACVLGPMGYLFADLGKHSYAPAAKGDGAPAAAQLLNFCSMETALGASWAGLRRRCHKMYHHLAIAAEFERQHGTPIAAGSQEAIRALSEQLAAKHGVSLESAVPWEGLMEFVAASALPGMPAVAAVLGGVLAQEVLKAVSGKGEPIRNFFFFSLADSAGTMEAAGC